MIKYWSNYTKSKTFVWYNNFKVNFSIWNANLFAGFYFLQFFNNFLYYIWSKTDQ